MVRYVKYSKQENFCVYYMKGEIQRAQKNAKKAKKM